MQQLKNYMLQALAYLNEIQKREHTMIAQYLEEGYQAISGDDEHGYRDLFTGEPVEHDPAVKLLHEDYVSSEVWDSMGSLEYDGPSDEASLKIQACAEELVFELFDEHLDVLVQLLAENDDIHKWEVK